MEILYWSIIAVLILGGFLGIVYPIIPSVLFIAASYICYGFFFTFSEFTWVFWLVQIIFILILFVSDYIANMFGIKKYGGSKAAVWGSTIGIIAGPILLTPLIGLLAGPFVGAIIAELLVHKKSVNESVKVGVGSLIGFLTGAVAKFFIQTIMIVYFFISIF